MSSPLSGISLTDIGQGYDCALGYDNGSTIRMVGYTLQPGTQWQESTDIQDEQHLVQISNNQTDRYARYPKVSQGDWSGGERQTFYVDPTKYFKTDGGINVTVPGQLQLFNPRMTGTVSGNNNLIMPVATDGNTIWISYQDLAGHNLATATSNGTAITVTKRVCGDGTTQVTDIVGFTPNLAICGFATGGDATHGVQQINTTGGLVLQYSNDRVLGTQTPYMAIFNNNIYYLTTAVSGISSLNFVPLATPAGNVAGTVAVTAGSGDGTFGTLFSTGTNLVFTSALQGSSSVSQSVVWTFDGATATRIGFLPGAVVGGGVVNGIVYLICNLFQDYAQTGQPGAFGGYVVYQVDGTSISIFDDYRAVDIAFQNQNQVQLFGGGNFPDCNVTGDGRYMYLAMPGFPIRAYDLLTPGNPVFQYSPFIPDTSGLTNISAHKIISTSPNGNWFTVVELQSDNGGVITVSQQGGSQNIPTGSMTLSYMDFGAPDDVKHLQKVFVDLVQPLGDNFVSYQPVQVSYRLDNQTAFTPMTIQVNTQTGNLFAYFPTGTRASRVQLQVILGNSRMGTTSGLSPSIRSVSVKATLGRSWTFTVVADRNQRLRNQGFSAGEDTQGANAQTKLGNIINAYRQASGDVTMFIPSPTSPTGVEQVQAVIQDYKYGTNTQVGPYTTEYGNTDMEGSVQLTVTETL